MLDICVGIWGGKLQNCTGVRGPGSTEGVGPQFRPAHVRENPLDNFPGLGIKDVKSSLRVSGGAAWWSQSLPEYSPPSHAVTTLTQMQKKPINFIQFVVQRQHTQKRAEQPRLPHPT